MEPSSSGGWELLFERHAPAREEVAVIAEKNVFSPLRKAWTPPPPPEPEKVPEEPKAPPPPPKRDGVELRGTAMVGDTRTAMVHFRLFNPPETLLLCEGGVAKPSKADGPVFTMVRIEPDRVIMKDSAGEIFVVGFTHPLAGKTIQSLADCEFNLDDAIEAPCAFPSLIRSF